jgi:hypothetical protein
LPKPGEKRAGAHATGILTLTERFHRRIVQHVWGQIVQLISLFLSRPGPHQPGQESEFLLIGEAYEQE